MARFAVGEKLTGPDLLENIESVICAFFTRGFIVNQVCSHGAGKHVSALKSLATLTAKDVLPSLDPKIPQDTLVVFKHSASIENLVFIGGEMPLWINRVVNGLEYSSKSGHKRNLMLNVRPLNLGMIRKACETVELRGIATLTQSKITINHFVKNPYSCMRVFLSAQILSSYMHELLY